MLNALRTCLLRLRSYYNDIGAAQNLSLAPSHTHPRFYPYPTSFTDEGNQVIHFEYDTALEAHASVTYKATTFQNDTIVVKFVSRYCYKLFFLRYGQTDTAEHFHLPKT